MHCLHLEKAGCGMRGPSVDRGIKVVSIHSTNQTMAPARTEQPPNRALERAKLVRRVILARTERSNHLSSRLFSEPAWDMLLELYLAFLMQRRMSVTDLCEGSRAPATTALRWIDALKGEDLVVRRRDPFDGRRIFVELTPKGSDALFQYFEAVTHRVWPVETRIEKLAAAS